MTSKLNTRTIKTILFAGLIMTLIIPVFGLNQAYAQAPEDPYLNTLGSLETTTKVIDGFLYVTQTYTSDDLHRKYGFDKIYKERIVPIQGNYTDGQTMTRIEGNIQLKLIHESESAKITSFQDRVNGGRPLDTHEKWLVLVPETDHLQKTVHRTSLTFATHVPAWSYKNTGVYVVYDPIDVVWDDTSTKTDPMITAVTNKLTSSGWNTSCVASTLYANISGRGWVPQDQHVYKTVTLPCSEQHHVRLWYIDSNKVIGAAHKEYASLTSYDIHHIATSVNYWEYGIFPGHVVTSFENGETQVYNDSAGSCWSRSSNSHTMNNSYTREYWQIGILKSSAYNNGLATLINRTC